MATSSLEIYPSNCEACRKSRRKCNRIKPCSNCQLRGINDECYATVPERRSKRETSSRASRISTSPRRRHDANQRTAVNLRGSGDDTTASRNISISNKLPPSRTNTSSTTYINSDHQQTSQHNEDDALQLLSSVPADTAIKWTDVGTFFSSAAHCHQLFCFYFDELLPDVSFIDKTSLLARVEILWHAQGSITRQEAAVVFWVLTHACLSVPSKHPLRSNIIDLNKEAELYRKVASALQMPTLLHMTRYEMLLDASLHALEALWFAFHSKFEAHWQSTGAGIRRCAALHLFSPHHRYSVREEQGQTGKQEIIINTTHLSQKLRVMDRWIAFTDLRAYGVHPSDVVEQDTSGQVLCLRAWIESIQIKSLEDGRDFLLEFESGHSSKQKLLSDLRFVLGSIDRQFDTVIRKYTNDTAVNLDPALCAQGDSGPTAAVLVSWLAACAFIGCSVAMPFIHDTEAPMPDRLASLRYASNLMSCVPIITSIYQHGMHGLRVTRLSNHLFYALRAVILTLSGLDVQPIVAERHKWESLLLGRFIWPQENVASSSLGRHIDDLSLIQKQFGNSMALLELFSAGGNRTAKRAFDLIENILMRNSSLSATLAWSASSKQGDYSVDKSREAFAYEWSLIKSGTIQQSPSATIQDNQSSSSQRAIDAMLWQSPQINFLSPEDIEQILASFG